MQSGDGAQHTDIELGSTCSFCASRTAHFARARPGFTRALAAPAEPSRDVYVAAKQFQTNKLLGYPGRRPDAARRPPI